MKLALIITIVLCSMGVAQAQEIPRQQVQYPQQIMVPRTQWVPYKLDSIQQVPPQPRPIWEPIRRLRFWIRYRPGYQVPRYVPVEAEQ